MHLIKVGTKFINLSNVYQVTFNDVARESSPEKELEATLDVITSASTYDENNSPIEAAGMRVFGQEAEALHHYLNSKAVNIDACYQAELKRQAEFKRIDDWYARFEDFANRKGIKDDLVNRPNNIYVSNPRYDYRVYLQQNNAPEHWQEPNEETYAAHLAEQEQSKGIPAEITW